MVITLKQNPPQDDVNRLHKEITDAGCRIHACIGDVYTVYGIEGDTSQLDVKTIKANKAVHDVVRIVAPYKLANRLFHPEDSVIDVDGIKVGGKEPVVVIGGPCSVESEEMVVPLRKR